MVKQPTLSWSTVLTLPLQLVFPVLSLKGLQTTFKESIPTDRQTDSELTHELTHLLSK
jgi:hypothetical protein